MCMCIYIYMYIYTYFTYYADSTYNYINKYVCMRTLCISYARLYHGVLYICLFFRRSQLQLRSRTQRNFAAWLVGP